MTKHKGGHRARSFSIPIAPVVGLIVGVANPAKRIMSGDIDGGINELSIKYLGFNRDSNTFNAMDLMGGLVPLILGAMIHKYVGGKLGLNRMLAASGVPIIRL